MVRAPLAASVEVVQRVDVRHDPGVVIVPGGGHGGGVQERGRGLAAADHERYVPGTGGVGDDVGERVLLEPDLDPDRLAGPQVPAVAFAISCR